MKFLIILSFLFSHAISACVIQFQVIETTKEEQAKGPMKVTKDLQEDHTIDAAEVVRISMDKNTDESSDNIVFYFKNSDKLYLSYDEKLFKDLKEQFTRCKGK